MTQQPIYLTKKGFKNLRKEIAKLGRDKKRLEKSLRGMDRVDNREVFYVRNDRLHQLAAVESEIAEKSLHLKRAQILSSKCNPLEVAIGSVVDLFDSATGRTRRYQIVDSLEVDPAKGKISVESPLGQQLLGKQSDDTIEFQVGLRQKTFQLLRVC